jgi:hypothetical protein
MASRPRSGHVAFYVTVYIGVAFSAIVCGYFPATVTGAVGFLGMLYWFIDHSLLLIHQPTQVHSIVGSFLVCVVLALLGATNRSKQLRLNNTVDALTTEARERKRVQEECAWLAMDWNYASKRELTNSPLR